MEDESLAWGRIQIEVLEYEKYDVEPPVLNNCQNIDRNTDTGQPNANVLWTAPTVTDNSGDSLISTCDHSPGFFDIGDTTVTCEATDSSNNNGQCQFTISVQDNEAPIFDPACPQDISQNTDAGSSTTTVNWSEPQAKDNTGILTPTRTYEGNTFSIGDTVVQYSAEDNSGNRVSCEFTVTVTDTEDPVFETSCPPDIYQNTDIGLPTATVTWEVPTAIDNSGVVELTQTPGGNIFGIGETVVQYVAEDDSGNSISCQFTVTVNDMEDPTITCPPDTTVNTDSAKPTADMTQLIGTATVSDNLGPITPTTDPLLVPIGTSTVTFTATDATGNSQSCDFDVTVEDKEPPNLTCIPDKVSDTDTGIDTADVSWTWEQATDNSGFTPEIVRNFEPGIFPIGVTIITYSATDQYGNTASCDFEITVSDNEKPSMTCPTNIEEVADSGDDGTTVDWDEPTAEDNADEDVSVVLMSEKTPGSKFFIGTETIRYKATDDYDNFRKCNFDVKIIDTEDPVFETSCPPDIYQNTDTGLPTATVTWEVPTAIDNSGVVELTQTPGGNIFDIGETVVQYVAEDDSGNSISCQFTVTVNDTENPNIQGCPTNIVQGTDPGEASAVVSWESPTITDNSGLASVDNNTPPGSTFRIRTKTIWYKAVDIYNNKNKCIFTVTVYDYVAEPQFANVLQCIECIEANIVDTKLKVNFRQKNCLV
ncbi:hyalin-like [Glandiceps talaboti]